MSEVIVLNGNFEFLNFCSWKRALVLVETGKAKILKASKKIVKNFDGTFTFAIPYVILLTKMVRSIFKRKVPWSKKNVFIRDKYQCQYCGKENLKKPELEHVLPKSKGGKTNFENCVCACEECNRKKGDKSCSEVNMYLLKQPKMPTIHEFMIQKLNSNPKIKDLLEEIYNGNL